MLNGGILTDIRHSYVQCVLLSLFTLLTGCLSSSFAADLPVGCDKPIVLQPITFIKPNLSLFKDELLRYRCMKQDQDTELAVQEAQAWVRLRAPQITNSTPAIVLDIDETSLSNWRRIYQDEYLGAPPACYFKNERCTDRDWQWTAKAPAVQPVLELYNLAQCVRFGQPCSKVDVYFVTGRHEGGKYVPTELCANGQQDACQKLALTPREWTLENLKNAGFVNVTDDHLRMRSDSDGSVSDYKTGERRKIENNGQVTIIANVGDQQSDLVGLHAERTFKVPNPFYFIP